MKWIGTERNDLWANDGDDNAAVHVVHVVHVVARPANQCTSTPLPSPQMVMHFGNAEIIKLSSDQCQFSYNARCCVIVRPTDRSCACAVWICAHNRHINEWLCFVHYLKCGGKRFLFRLLFIAGVLYAPSRFLFVCTIECAWISQRLGISKLLARTHALTNVEHLRIHQSIWYCVCVLKMYFAYTPNWMKP